MGIDPGCLCRDCRRYLSPEVDRRPGLMAVSRYVSSRSEVSGGSLAIWTSMPSMSFSTALSCSVRCFSVCAMVYLLRVSRGALPCGALSVVIRLAGDSAPEAGGMDLTLAAGRLAGPHGSRSLVKCFVL